MSDREREGQLAHDAAEALTRLAAEAKELETRIAAAEGQRPAFAGRIASAEATVRDAEVELAQALAAQAREQAETRVAEGALAAANARLDRAERDKAQIDHALSALGSDAALIAQRDAAQALRLSAEGDALAAATAIELAESLRSEAAARRETSESAGAAARATLAALEREAQALIKAVENRTGSSRALDKVKSASYSRGAPIESASELVAPDRSHGVGAGFDAAVVARALDHLSEDQRIVLEMGYFEGLSLSEIAEKLSVPVGTIKSRLSRALGRLREIVIEASEP